MINPAKQAKRDKQDIQYKKFINFQNSHFQKIIQNIIQGNIKLLQVLDIYLNIFDEILFNTQSLYPSEALQIHHFDQKKIIKNGLQLLTPLAQSKTHAFTKVKQENEIIYYLFKTYPSQIHGLIIVNTKGGKEELVLDDQAVYLNFMPIFELIEFNFFLNKKSKKKREIKKEHRHELLKNRVLELRSL